MKHLVVVLFFALSYSVSVTAQQESTKGALPVSAGLPDTLSEATLAKVRSVMVMPGGTLILLDSLSNTLFVDKRFSPHPMPNAYLGDRCIVMPNGYRGDDCVPMPNAYQTQGHMNQALRDSVKQAPGRPGWAPR